MIKEPLCIYKPVNFARIFKALKSPKHLLEIFYPNRLLLILKNPPEIKYLDFSQVKAFQQLQREGGNPILNLTGTFFFFSFLLIGRETGLESYFSPCL